MGGDQGEGDHPLPSPPPSSKFDGLAKSHFSRFFVILAKAGIQYFNMFWMPDQACPQLDWGSGMTIQGLFTISSSFEFQSSAFLTCQP
jgi:hypothetical protein